MKLNNKLGLVRSKATGLWIRADSRNSEGTTSDSETGVVRKREQEGLSSTVVDLTDKCDSKLSDGNVVMEEMLVSSPQDRCQYFCHAVVFAFRDGAVIQAALRVKEGTIGKEGTCREFLHASLVTTKQAFASVVQRKEAEGYKRIVLHQAARHLQGVQASHPIVEKMVEELHAEANAWIAAALGGCTITAEGISTPVGTLTVESVCSAERVLYSLCQALKDHDAQQLKSLEEEFYKTMPHPSMETLDNIKALRRKQELCDTLRSMMHVSEDLGGELGSCTSLAQHRVRSLQCSFDVLSEGDAEFTVIQECIDAQSPSSPIGRIYRITKQSSLVGSENGTRRLFHASKAGNWVGILCRGLVLPTVSECYGVSRTDGGFLGAGIYFGSSPAACERYTSRTKSGSFFMAVVEVALGNTFYTSDKMMHLVAPPEGYDSVATNTGLGSQFNAEEFCVFDPARCRITHLVEFNAEICKSKAPASSSPMIPVFHEAEPSGQTHCVADAHSSKIHKPKVTHGLVVNDQALPLVAVHVRAKIVDVVAEVVVLQHFNNEAGDDLEASYVFPLDGKAAVFSFEAFINGKHVVGEIKEKEKAREVYKQAVEQGHGAYLMEEEKADVFSVTVGNLPPKADVLIKISYVTELDVDAVDGSILFNVPSTLAPSHELQSALSRKLQERTKSVRGQSGTCATSIQISLSMPYKITTLASVHHSTRSRRTDTHATVELGPGEELQGKPFILKIGLETVREPRMWVEEAPSGSRACMLAFVPELPHDQVEDVEVNFVVDRSTSMGKNNALEDAVGALRACLAHMPSSWKFNVMWFGSSYYRVFPTSVDATVANVATAAGVMQEAAATFGGTNATQALRAAMGAMEDGCLSERARSVVVISDGQFADSAEANATAASFPKIAVTTIGVG